MSEGFSSERAFVWQYLEPLPKPEAPIVAGIRPDAAVRTELEYRARCFLAKWYRDLISMPPDSGRHNALRSKACAAGGLVATGLLDEQETYGVFLEACHLNGLTQDPGGAAERTIVDALAYGALTPWAPNDLPDTPAWRTQLDRIPKTLLRSGGRLTRVSDPPTELGKVLKPSISLKTGAELGKLVLPDIEWLVKPYIVAGGLTELVGKVKSAGKSTWVCEAIRCTLDGLDFLGEPTCQTPVVFLTEQAGHSLRQTLQRAHLLEREDLFIAQWYEHAELKWPEMVRAAAEACVARGAKLLIVDTLSQWAGLRGDAENHAGDALEAVRPLQEVAANYGLGVIYTRHERKSGGDVGDSGRGSSAYAGAVDVILSLRRAGAEARPNVRHLESLSRYDETPTKLVIEYVDNRYVALADNGELAFTEVQYEIISALKMHKKLRTRQFTEMVSCKETQLKTTLRILTERGIICRGEVGLRGGFEYWLPEPEAEPDGLNPDLDL